MISILQEVEPGTLQAAMCQPFKATVLSGLLEEAVDRQELCREGGLADVYGLHAVCDVYTGEWTGQLYNYTSCTGRSLYEGE